MNRLMVMMGCAMLGPVISKINEASDWFLMKWCLNLALLTSNLNGLLTFLALVILVGSIRSCAYLCWTTIAFSDLHISRPRTYYEGGPRSFL